MPKGVFVRRSRPLDEKFWEKVNKRGPVPAHRPELGRCWVWTGAKSYGYGVMSHRGQMIRAHRYAYEREHGFVPSGQCVLHHCDNRACVRPQHHFVGARIDNSADMVEKGREAYGEKNGAARTSDADVARIRVLWAKTSALQRELGAQFGLSQPQISRIVRGVSRKRG